MKKVFVAFTFITLSFDLLVCPIVCAGGVCDTRAFYGVKKSFNTRSDFDCYSRHLGDSRNLVLLSLMYLNGDSAPFDPKKATELLKKSIQLSHQKTAEHEILEKKIKEKINTPVPNDLPKVSYCRTVAVSAEEIKWCAKNYYDYASLLEAEVLNGAFKEMGEKAKLSLQVLNAKFHEFINYESDFLVSSCDYKIVNHAKDMAEAKKYEIKAKLILEFNREVTYAADHRFPKRVVADDFKRNDSSLNDVYHDVGSKSDPAVKARLNKIELLWTHYRDAWINFVAVLLEGNAHSEARQLAIKNWLTSQEIQTLMKLQCE